jgi:hypothetical protein
MWSLKYLPKGTWLRSMLPMRDREIFWMGMDEVPVFIADWKLCPAMYAKIYK